MLFGRLLGLRLGYFYGTYNFPQIWTIDLEHNRDDSYQITFFLRHRENVIVSKLTKNLSIYSFFGAYFSSNRPYYGWNDIYT